MNLVAMTARDEPFLEGERPCGRVDEGAQLVVRRREDRRVSAERTRRAGRERREPLALAQRACAQEVKPEVAVAEPEPVLAAELRDGRERVPRLVRSSPAAFLVGDPGERVEDAVQIRR